MFNLAADRLRPAANNTVCVNQERAAQRNAFRPDVDTVSFLNFTLHVGLTTGRYFTGPMPPLSTGVLADAV